MMQADQGDFKDLTGLTKWVKWLLYANVVVAVIAIVSNGLEYQLLSDFENGVFTSLDAAIAAGDASDARQNFITLTQIILSITLGILILRWIYRANYNVRQLGATQLTFTPGWSIGWYFIPLFSLWKPYQAMKEIWMASANPRSLNVHATSWLLPWWWFCFIIYNIITNISSRMAMRAEEINELMVSNLALQVSHIAVIPLSLIMIAIVSKICEMQLSHATTTDKSEDSTAILTP
jgi:hypothetical protein